MKDHQFTQGPILPRIIRFTLPVFGALLLQSAYGATDLWVVSHFGAASGVSAVSCGSEIMILITCIINGLSMGSTVLIGQNIGRGKPEDAGRVVGASIALFTALALAMTVLMELLAVPLCRLMNVPEEAFEKTVSYVRICSAGIIFITGYNVISSIFRGLGNSRLPLLFVLIAAIFNVGGDFLLCGMFDMDAAGAAVATIAAQAVSVVLSLAIIRRQELPFLLKAEHVRLWDPNTKNVIRIGSPLALEDVLVHFSFLAVATFANGFGLNASAGYGVGNKLTSFIMLVPSSFSAGVTTFVSQNVGAMNYGRARRGLFLSMGAGVSIGILLFFSAFFGADAMAGLFTKDIAVAEQAALLIRGFALDCVLTNCLFTFFGYFNGHGKTTVVMLQGIFSALLIRIPVSYFFSRMPGSSLFYLGLATPITTLCGIVYFFCCFFHFAKKHPELQVDRSDSGISTH